MCTQLLGSGDRSIPAQARQHHCLLFSARPHLPRPSSKGPPLPTLSGHVASPKWACCQTLRLKGPVLELFPSDAGPSRTRPSQHPLAVPKGRCTLISEIARVTTHSRGTASSLDPTVGLRLGPYDGSGRFLIREAPYVSQLHVRHTRHAHHHF